MLFPRACHRPLAPAPCLPDLLDRGAVERPGRGRPRLRQRSIRPVIPTRAGERRYPSFDRETYRERNYVERLINRLKQFRAIATRYDKIAATYHAALTIAVGRCGSCDARPNCQIYGSAPRGRSV